MKNTPSNAKMKTRRPDSRHVQ